MKTEKSEIAKELIEEYGANNIKDVTKTERGWLVEYENGLQSNYFERLHQLIEFVMGDMNQ